MLGIAVFLFTLLAYIPVGEPDVWWVVASAHTDDDDADDS